ncbi:hypothetical protein BOTBODRAFT_55954 [Botryobasidium botryosum FD-172 SS1]|uniref:Uncharacterized protein n=1 Tax=Botryobasidium botryosum (strain FD-172 SS1) TaxID=930990 RepID=A0A067MDT4_BOTB1|nr:hypothetical protein BOTBODRAFT_55954 [Botryobasidium botryosum FD-172 SS1]
MSLHISISPLPFIHPVQLVVYARHDIQLRSKIVALLSLLQKYAETSTSLGEASLEVHVDADSEETPSDILQLLRLFLTRFAPPKHVDTLIAQARVVVRSLFSVPDIAIYLRDLKVWFERATKSQDDMQSQKQVIEDLYERGKELVTRADAEGGSTMTHIGLLLAQIDQVWTCVKNDRSMKQVATALIRVGRHLEQTTLAVAKPSQQRTQIEQEFIGEILVDITQWAVPRLLASLHSFAPIVIPRVEYTRSVGGSAWAADAVLDGLKLTSASFVPDHIVISNRNEIHLTPSNSLLSPGEQPIARPGLSLSSAWTKLHIDGLRLSIHDISYSVRFRRQRPGFFGRFLGWQDSGLLSVDLGQPSQSGTGLALNLDLHSSSDTGTRAFYEVRDSSADIAGLSLQFDKSRHWIFNQFLVRPLVVPVIRHALQSALEGAMQESARALDRMAFEAWWRVTQRRMAIEARGGTPDFWDYLDAARPPPSTQPAEVQENGHEAETNDVETVTKTQLTTKGIIRTTHATEEAAAAEGPDAELNHDPVRPRSASDTPIVLTPNESVVAVGVAGQILPDLSGPTIQ